ncbi:hypothetical protein [Brucella sp. NBRC 113783]|uniref:hypothetical protein n=1 Tax=Brucella sp. NBRC 113783 TaxID=3075478 RepID=UPI0029C0EF58|nr:hypothetical protein [Brucella sp. NBRC 113783]MDX4074582.1 hypothetical protein [Brucella sp. NBRC 113783]
MSLRDLIKNASPELLKSPVQTGVFYEALAEVMDAFSAVKKRLDALEEGGIKYRGAYQRAQDYSKGDVVTFNGCAWIAVRTLKETEAPASCDGWMLMVKKGRDA